MNLHEAIAARMEDLGYTQYKLTQKICKSRAEKDGTEVAPVTRYNSTIQRAVKTPEHTTVTTLLDVLKALDGELMIRWHNPQEVAIKQD
jgi:enterochelin esterase-like enzyme